MACPVIKVLDATTLSAFLFEIKSMDVLSRCGTTYDLTTSQEVFGEISKSKRVSNGTPFHKVVQAVTLNPDEIKLMNYLENRFPSLHRGDLSSFITALRYSKKGSPCYFVTDDKAMRASIDKIIHDRGFITMAGAG